MRILLLDYSPYGNACDEVSNRRLARAAAETGHSLDVVPWGSLRLVVGPGGARAFLAGADSPEADVVARYDVVMPRFDARDARDLALVQGAVRWLEALGLPAMPGAAAIEAAEDKVETARRLAALGLPAPRSAVLAPIASREAPGAADAAVDAVGGYPVVVKSPYGWGGHGVALAESRAALRSWLDVAGHLAPNATYLVQSRVPHEVSVHVVAAGGEVVADGQKTVAPGEFRTNTRLGGRQAPARLTDQERDLALRALAGLGIEVGSVDLARGPEGPVVLEVNACPGIAGVADEPIAGRLVAATTAVARRAGRG